MPPVCGAFGVFAVLSVCVAVVVVSVRAGFPVSRLTVCAGFSAADLPARAGVFVLLVCAFAVPALSSAREAAFTPALCAAPPRSALAGAVFAVWRAAAALSGTLAASAAPTAPGWGAYSVSTGRTARSVGASAAAGVRFAVCGFSALRALFSRSGMAAALTRSAARSSAVRAVRSAMRRRDSPACADGSADSGSASSVWENRALWSCALPSGIRLGSAGTRPVVAFSLRTFPETLFWTGRAVCPRTCPENRSALRPSRPGAAGDPSALGDACCQTVW